MSFFEEYEAGRAFAQRREDVVVGGRHRARKRLASMATKLAKIGVRSPERVVKGSGTAAILSVQRYMRRNAGDDILAEGLAEIREDTEMRLREINDFLGIEDDDNGVREYIEGIHFGDTFDNREARHGSHFFLDIALMIVAGRFLGWSRGEITGAVSNGFDSLYDNGGLIDMARGDGFSYLLPSYGSGVSRVGAKAILDNVGDTIAIGAEMLRLDYEKGRGALGYYVFRGSTYPCSACDDEVGWFHSLDDPGVPVHNRCRCFMVYVHSMT